MDPELYGKSWKGSNYIHLYQFKTKGCIVAFGQDIGGKVGLSALSKTRKFFNGQGFMLIDTIETYAPWNGTPFVGYMLKSVKQMICIGHCLS